MEAQTSDKKPKKTKTQKSRKKTLPGKSSETFSGRQSEMKMLPSK